MRRNSSQAGDRSPFVLSGEAHLEFIYLCARSKARGPVREGYTRNCREGGSGLGLNISRAIIQHHGGVLAFDTEVGVGSRSIARLPLGLSNMFASLPSADVQK